MIHCSSSPTQEKYDTIVLVLFTASLHVESRLLDRVLSAPLPLADADRPQAAAVLASWVAGGRV